MSASLGGTIATNAGGMRAVKYGVTRQHVLGLEAVLASGEVLRTGGKNVKTSAGYDLTQLITGSEGTLALVTEATVRLYPRLPYQATVLAPFASLEQVTAAVPRIVASGIGPLILEYLDMLTMAVITESQQLDLGVPVAVRESALAYLVVMVEERSEERLGADVEALAEQLADLGAADVYVLPAPAARRLIEAREKAFWAARSAGADDIVDAVVPRAAMASFLAAVTEIAAPGRRAGGGLRPRRRRQRAPRGVRAGSGGPLSPAAGDFRGGRVPGRGGQRGARHRHGEEELLPGTGRPRGRGPDAAGEAGLRPEGHPEPGGRFR